MATPAKSKRATTAARTSAGTAGNGDTTLTRTELKRLVEALRAAKNGDFSARLSAATDSGLGEVAVAFNELAERQESFAFELPAGQPSDRAGRTNDRAGVVAGSGRVLGAGDRSGQRDDRQPRAADDRGRTRHRRGRRGRPVPEDGAQDRRPPGARASSSASARRSTRWSTSSRPSPTRSPAWRARSAPRASSAARPRCKGVSGTWKDLTDNVNLMAVATSPARCATSPRSPPPSPTATCRKKITVDARARSSS